MQKPIVDKQFLVEKRTTENGFKFSEWVFVVLPAIPTAQKSKMGTIRVKGFIDNYALKQYNLLPMKGGCMLLPLKAAVRKKIGKKEGDFVHVKLFIDDSATEIPVDILSCIMESQKAYSFFQTLSESNQKYYVDWIEAAQKKQTKEERIVKTIERLEKEQKFYYWEKKE